MRFFVPVTAFNVALETYREAWSFNPARYHHKETGEVAMDRHDNDTEFGMTCEEQEDVGMDVGA